MTIPFDFTKETIKANTTLYAKWKKIDISFSIRAVVSSLELEVKTALALTDVGAVIRLANQAVPNLTKAQASKGYVSLSIDVDSTRKFSISQHYTTDFSDGLTLADVLTPDTEYKLYLYPPSTIDLEQIAVKGGEVKENSIEISFTTASLPVAGDVIWNEKWVAKKSVSSLNEYHFMENQTGVFIMYFQSPYIPFTHECTFKDLIGRNTGAAGRYLGSSMTATPLNNFYFNMELIAGYPSTATSQTFYVIAADNGTSVLRHILTNSITPSKGHSVGIDIPIFRY